MEIGLVGAKTGVRQLAWRNTKWQHIKIRKQRQHTSIGHNPADILFASLFPTIIILLLPSTINSPPSTNQMIRSHLSHPAVLASALRG